MGEKGSELSSKKENLFSKADRFVPALFREAALYGLTSILGRFLNYLLVPLYTRVMSPEVYGQVAIFYALISFFLVGGILAPESAFFYFAGKEKEKVRYVFGSSLFVNICGGLIMGTMGALILLLGPWNFSILSGVLFALIVMLDCTAIIPYAYLRRKRQALQYSLVRSLGIGVNLAFNLLFYLILRRQNAEFVYISNAISSGVVVALLLPMVKNEIKKMIFFPGMILQMLKYSLPLVVAGVAGMVNDNADRIILSLLYPGETHEKEWATGVYSACYKIGVLVLIATGAVRLALEPVAYEILRRNEKQKFQRIAFIVIAGVGTIALATIYFLDILKYFVAQVYYEGLHIVPIVAFSYVFYSVAYVNSFWYKITGLTGWGMGISMGSALLTIILCYFSIPVMGISGAAWATLLTYLTMAVVSWVTSQIFNPILTIKTVLTPLFLCFAFLGLYRLMKEHVHAVFPLAEILLLIVYWVVALVLLKKLNLDEKSST